MGKRFAIVIAVAAAGVMALGTQTAAAATYNTKVTITQDLQAPGVFMYGKVISGVRKCEVGRRVDLFKQRPGTDRLLGTARSRPDGGGSYGAWGMFVPGTKAGWHVYARARRAVRPAIGLVCRRDRSPIHTVQ